MDGAENDGGVSADEAFGLLANETRVEILRLLWAEHRPYVETSLTFSELLTGVDYDDAGNFSYHLEKLLGTFVRKTDDGYELREAGHKVLRSVHAGTVTDDPSFAVDLERDCPNCGGDVRAQYARERLLVRCTECEGVIPQESTPEGLIFAAEVPPAILEGRSPEEVLAAAVTWNASQYGALTEGVCPDCAGRLSRSPDVCEDHPVGDPLDCADCGSRFAVWIRHRCENCGYSRRFGLWAYAWQHPDVNAFYLDHGLDVNGITWEEAGRLVDSIEREAVLSTDPLRVRQVIDVGGDELEVTLDDDLDVVGVDRRDS